MDFHLIKPSEEGDCNATIRMVIRVHETRSTHRAGLREWANQLNCL